MFSTLSFHDTAGQEPERVYHAFVLGLLVHLSYRYTVRSNRESGYGRYDLMLIPLKSDDAGFVFEFKKIRLKTDATPEIAMQSALKQIRDKNYAAELRISGTERIYGVGVVIDGKQVWVEAVIL